MKKDAKSKKKSRIRLLHQYYSYTGFYSFVWKSVKKAILPIVLFVAALWAIDRYVLDIEQMLVTVTETYSPLGIISVFFASESIDSNQTVHKTIGFCTYGGSISSGSIPQHLACRY